MTIRHGNHQAFQPSLFRTAMLAIVPALLLAGCGGTDGADPASPSAATGQATSDSRVADSANVDAAIEDNPCQLLTAEMVASVFGVPAAELEETVVMSSKCSYTWESGDQQLEATVDVAGVYDDAEAAASQFRAVTAGMSGADLDRAMDGIKKEAASKTGGGSADAVDAVADAGSSGGSKGIQFEDVEGVGDEARMALTVGAGSMYVRVGNLNFTVSAYSGPGMQIPAKRAPGSILAAHKAWQQETLPQRKQAAVKLGKAIVAAL